MSLGTWAEQHPWMTFFLASSAISGVVVLIRGRPALPYGLITPEQAREEDVIVWQQNLIDAGFGSTQNGPVQINGTFDAPTASATKNFKAWVGLPANTTVDTATEAAMERELAGARPAQVPMDPSQLVPALDISGRLPASTLPILAALAVAGGAYYWSQR
jgi:peptidoglycan hydrolase-like protein with peptidoglycan-binding domain